MILYEIYESLKQYYEEHGEIMPPSQFIKFRNKHTEQEMVQAVMEFDSYLDQIRSWLSG